MSKLSDRIIQVLIRKDISIHAQLFRFMSQHYLPGRFLWACFSGQERNSSNMISVLSF